jgi:hypothetical protein
MSAKRADGKGAGSIDVLALWNMVDSDRYRAMRYQPPWLTALFDELIISPDSTLAKVWRDGHESGDASRRDASLARCALNLGLDDRDAAELIMCARLRDGAKVEKVNPHTRRDYVIRTVDKVAAEHEKAEKAREEREAAAEKALASMDQHGLPPIDLGEGNSVVLEHIPAGAASNGHVPVPSAAVPTGMGAHIVAALAADSAVIAVEPGTPVGTAAHNGAHTQVSDSPNGAHSGTGGEDVEPEPDALPPPVVLVGPPPAADRPADGEPEPAPDDDHERGHEAFTPHSRVNPWGTRTEAQHRELTALSQFLLGPLAEHVQIWRLQYSGRGADQKRRIVVRYSSGFRWPGQPPSGWVDGELYAGGWYPAGAFRGLPGFLRALEQDCQVTCARVSPDEYNQRFGRTLIPLWEPDDSGGSLASVTLAAITEYLQEYPPTIEWAEAAAQGVPLIVQRGERWTLESRFSVLVRWDAFARHVRARHGVNVTPQIAAEMRELSGSRPAKTTAQDGRWCYVRREYLGDQVWAAILHAGKLAEQRREEHHGMRVVGSEPRERPAPGAHRDAAAGESS